MYTDANGLTEQQFLKQYQSGDYPRPSVAVDIVICTIAKAQNENYRKLPEKELRVLLIRRGGHPYIGQWALPGGFVHPDESVGEAANRELEEETGVQGGYLEQLYTFSNPERDPRTWVISCAHMALIDSGNIQLRAGTDAEDARWFKLTAEADLEDNCVSLKLLNGDIRLSAVVKQSPNSDEYEIIENNGLAFDHAKIIICAANRLKAKLEYTDLVFRLMPDKFTLTELQQAYEIILGKPLLKAAFRRKVKELVRETGEYTQEAGHRPSQLFVRNREALWG